MSRFLRERKSFFLNIFSNIYFRKCHTDVDPPAWKDAVEEELKEAQTVVLEKLLNTKFSKHFIRSNKATIFQGTFLEEQQKLETVESQEEQHFNQFPEMLKSPEVEKVKKALAFDDEVEIKSENNSENSVSSEDKNTEKRSN